MEIDNNHLVTRYYDLQAKNPKPFLAVRDYADAQIKTLYDQLKTTFADSVVFSIDDAMAAAEKAGMDIDPGDEEIAVTNYLLKHLDSLGLSIEPIDDSDPNTIVAKLNFGNRSRYY